MKCSFIWKKKHSLGINSENNVLYSNFKGCNPVLHYNMKNWYFRLYIIA